MVTKGFKDFLAEANAAIEVVSAQDAVALLGRDDVVFVDVREGQERTQGSIPTSVHAPRGFLEFIADPEGPESAAFRAIAGRAMEQLEQRTATELPTVH